jgi:hypothetical protein
VTERRKLPITVHTLEWNGANSAEMFHFCGDAFRTVYDHASLPVAAQVYDKLHDSWINVLPGQHIVRGIRGEFYPIDPDVLAETYASAPTSVYVIPPHSVAEECRRMRDRLFMIPPTENDAPAHHKVAVIAALDDLAERLDSAADGDAAPAPVPLLQQRTPANTCRYLAEALTTAKVSERTVTIAGVTVALGLLADRLDADAKAAAEAPEALRDANLAAVEARGETVRLAHVLREVITTFNPLSDHKGRVFGWQSRLALPDVFDRWDAVASTATGDVDEVAVTFEVPGGHLSLPAYLADIARTVEKTMNAKPVEPRSTVKVSDEEAATPAGEGAIADTSAHKSGPENTSPQATAAKPARAPVTSTFEADQLRAFIERGFDTHMQFGVLEADGTTTMLPCADWCYACKLEKAEAEVKRLRDGEEDGYGSTLDPTPGQWIWRWNQAGPGERLEVAEHIMREMSRADSCRDNGHTERLAELAHLQHVHRSMLTLADQLEGEHGRGADTADRIRTILYGTVDVSGTPAAEPVQPPAEPQASAVPGADDL